LRAVILDIEGTTTPIAFVYDRLFPYAQDRLRHYLEVHGDSPECRAIGQRLKREHDADLQGAGDAPAWDETTKNARVESIERYVRFLMHQDRKSPALKELQGRIWEEGYATGELAGDFFSDVAPALRRWRQQSIDTGIFSSGSVLAQQLLFRHSVAGDLTSLIRWYFDTSIGAKTDPASYVRIGSTIAAPAAEILFISDVVRELDAAREAGMRTALCIRPGNATQQSHGHSIVHGFDEVTA
jgi:enolase-phosphatase E1